MVLDPTFDLSFALVHFLRGVVLQDILHFEPGDDFVFDERFGEVRIILMDATHGLLGIQ